MHNLKETLIQLNLTEKEYDKIVLKLDRIPNFLELGIFSAMWSEHCSYKSTKKYLKKLHTQEEWVICGPGENAGIIDIGNDKALVFKMESHNHPSYIEPFHGAATGVGGIIRDIFTMGAKPIALLNSLWFGDITHHKTKYLCNQVVKGIGYYGNCVGIPNINGSTYFHKTFNENILVNAMCVGLVDKNKIFYSAASNIGSKIVYVGAKTGCDGIHGASMSSAEFSNKQNIEKTTIQVGDPFVEKLLIEACLELMKHEVIISIQDMGAAGLTSSAVEMASKGNTGVKLILDDVPQRQKNMTPFDMMLSESQERMMLTIKPGKEKLVKAIFDKWNLDAMAIGEVIKEKQLQIMFQNQQVANIPITLLIDEVEENNRDVQEKTQVEDNINMTKIYQKLNKANIIQNINKLIGKPNFCSRKYIFQQYDSQVGAKTISKANANTGAVKIKDEDTAIVMKTTCNPHYILQNPFAGTIQTIVENYRTIVATGAKPLAITNCLNFASPDSKEIMRQIVETIEAMTHVCKKLQYPVISGNVSLNNQTNGQPILPVPNIGGVGVIQNYTDYTDNLFKNADDIIMIVGNTKGNINQSSLLREIYQIETGNIPNVELQDEKITAQFIQNIIQEKLVNSASSINKGGIITKLIENAIEAQLTWKVDIAKIPNQLQKNIDKYLDEAKIVDPQNKRNIKEQIICFAEDQARYLITVENQIQAEQVKHVAKNYKIVCQEIGTVLDKKENFILTNLAQHDEIINYQEIYTKYYDTIEKLFN